MGLRRRGGRFCRSERLGLWLLPGRQLGVVRRGLVGGWLRRPGGRLPGLGRRCGGRSRSGRRWGFCRRRILWRRELCWLRLRARFAGARELAGGGRVRSGRGGPGRLPWHRGSGRRRRLLRLRLRRVRGAGGGGGLALLGLLPNVLIREFSFAPSELVYHLGSYPGLAPLRLRSGQALGCIFRRFAAAPGGAAVPTGRVELMSAKLGSLASLGMTILIVAMLMLP